MRLTGPATTIIVTLLTLATACGEVPLIERLAPDRTCRRTLVVGPLGVPADAAADTAAAAEPDENRDEDEGDGQQDGAAEVGWRGPVEGAQRHQLNAWCAAVGPAVFGGWADPPTDPVDSVAVVSWNLHVGGGDLRRLVDDLRVGRLTGGRPVHHFVLLLQEAYREDDTVPTFDPDLPLGSAVIAGPPSGPRSDIVDLARELGLSLFYAPSMRNGEGRGDEEPEDRGNAILATLPLGDPTAIELPVARQRRVAVSASVTAAPPGQEGPRFQVTSVHLENDAAGFARDERARLLQTETLLEALPDAPMAVAGGDFNTWSRGPDEALVREMLRAFPDTPPFPAGHTYVRAYGLVRRYLDYLFVRLPEGARVRVFRVDDPYASDHLPIVGWVVFPETAAAENGG